MRGVITISTFLLIIVLITFVPRVLSISAHWATDETLWMERSRDFFFAMQSGKFADTNVSYHPGVTTCWLGSIAIWNKYLRDPSSKSWFYSGEFFSPEMLASIRLPIVLVTGMLILIIGVLIYRLFGRRIAGLATLFLAVEPFLLSESRRAHTDALTTLFLFLSLLLWICYLESDTFRRRNLIFSGICFAFACLTKSLAGAFFLFLPLLFAWYIKQRKLPWRKLFWGTITWMMSALLTVLVAWPYLWTATFKIWNLPMFPILFLISGALLIWSSKKLTDTLAVITRKDLLVTGYGIFVTIGGIATAVLEVIARMYMVSTHANIIPVLFLGEIRYDPGIFFFPVMWFIWTAPLTLPLMAFAIYWVWQQRNQNQKTFRVVIVLVVFALFYLIGLSCVAKKISRYFLIFLPAVSLITTVGVVQLAQLFKKKHLQFISIIVILVMQITPVLRLHPYYRTYYHPLLSGKWVSENTSSITGAGLDLAADYLNALPNAEHLLIRLSSPFTYDLAFYFDGFATRRGVTWNTQLKYHYDVEHLYDRQIYGTPVDSPPASPTQLTVWQESQELKRELKHVVCLNGIEYVWIYRVLPEETP